MSRYYDDDYGDDDDDFADPEVIQPYELRRRSNPRNLPCPTCGCANRLTPKDRALGYQCNSCADRAERGGY